MIKIFIETNLKGPAKREGRFVYVLQYCSESGKTAEFNSGGLLNNVGENELFLAAVVDALSHITKSSSVIFYVENKYFINTYLNGWLKDWKQLGWCKADGTAPANAMLWQAVDKYLQCHSVSFNESRENEFGNWLKSELLLNSTVFVSKYFRTSIRQRLKGVEDLINKEGRN